MFSLVGGLFQWMCAREESRLLVIGLGDSGKTTFVEQCKRLYVPKYTGIPLESISQTIGMNLARFKLPKVEVTMWDVGGTMQNLWSRYYGEADGVLFVIDASDAARREVVQSTLRDVLNHAAMPDHIPLAIVLNKVDSVMDFDISNWVRLIEGVDSVASLTVDGIGTDRSAASAPSAPFRRTRIFSVSAKRGDGTEKVLEWIVKEATAAASRMP